MMAQRFPEAQVTAIDIDANACQQARENIQASPFFDRIRVIETKIQDFEGGGYDTIVSNPPFFMDSLKNPDTARLAARHTDKLSYRDLFTSVKRLLTETGEFSAIIPSDYLERFISESCISGFFVSRRYGIRTVPKISPDLYEKADRKDRLPGGDTDGQGWEKERMVSEFNRQFLYPINKTIPFLAKGEEKTTPSF
jgi:tRNA1Val (adenine37-N6)-methyltransferase